MSAAGWKTAFALAREAQAVGLVVVKIEPFFCSPLRATEFTVSLWQPDGKIWAEGHHESLESVRAHFTRWEERS